MDLLKHHGDAMISLNRHPSGEEQIQQDTDRVEVRLSADTMTLNLLRRDKPRCPSDASILGHLKIVVVVFGDPKIQHHKVEVAL